MSSADHATILLANMLRDEGFCRKVAPHLKGAYFDSTEKRLLFETISEFLVKYNKIPTPSALDVILSTTEKANHPGADGAREYLDVDVGQAMSADPVDIQWLTDHTEKWCKERALYNAVMESISIIDGSNPDVGPSALPSILEKALAVSFDSSIGHEYVGDAEARYDFYHEDLERIPFDLEILNEITRGGICRKTLSAFVAGTGVGKSLVMCHLAASYLKQGRNVLYVTLEMSEERIAERIDANLLDVEIDRIAQLSKTEFVNRVNTIGSKSTGKLIIKEYPTSCAHAGHLRALLNELKLKKNFIPDVIFVDYLNIMASSRIKASGASETYTYVKAIAEELRGLATEFDLPIWTATQANREGNNNSDIALSNTSESFGTPMALDLYIAVMANEDLDEQGQLLFKQLKNRYNDLNFKRRFLVGVNKAKMKLFDVAASAQSLLMSATKKSTAPTPAENSPFAIEKKSKTSNFQKLKV
jgi:replicative DNA helicase